jgi:hypothetical protein
MNKYREGQLVEITWPNGTSIKGVLSKHLAVQCPPTGYSFYVKDDDYTRDGRTIVILSEPRPEEPNGLGAVVEAASRTYPRERRIYLRDNMSFNRKTVWRSKMGTTSWDDLHDPVVLCSGWSPKCTCNPTAPAHATWCPLSEERAE